MMKSIISIFAFTFLLLTNAFANEPQNEITRLSYKSTINDDVDGEAFVDIRYYDLYINNEQTVWIKIPEKCEESIHLVLVGETLYSKIDATNGSILCQQEVNHQRYNVEKTYKPFEWVITDETKVIAGWNCIKAERKDKPQIYAWFTTDVPITYGPNDCFGLPGMVVLYHRFTSVYTLEEITTAKKFPELPKGGKKISEEELTRKMYR